MLVSSSLNVLYDVIPDLLSFHLDPQYNILLLKCGLVLSAVFSEKGLGLDIQLSGRVLPIFSFCLEPEAGSKTKRIKLIF